MAYVNLCACAGEVTKAVHDVGSVSAYLPSRKKKGWVGGVSMSMSRATLSFVFSLELFPQGSKICMQILHSGRYAYHPFAVSASSVQAPIAPFMPRELSGSSVEQTVTRSLIHYLANLFHYITFESPTGCPAH